MDLDTFLTKIKSAGFVPNDKYYNPVNGWFGCTKQHPDCWFVNNNKMITFSLHGVGTGIPYNMQEFAVYEAGASKYIEMRKNKYIMYRNFFGILPDEETLNNFING